MESEKVGFVRASKSGEAINVSIDLADFEKAKALKFPGKGDREYVRLVINKANLDKVMAGEKDVTTISQILDSAPAPADEPAAEPAA